MLRTVVIVCVWAVVHIATHRLLKRLHHLEEYLRVCAWCRKMDHQGKWVTMEDYFQSAFATQASHGVCPECSRTLANPETRQPFKAVRTATTSSPDRA
jgi:hypothetical protein